MKQAVFRPFLASTSRRSSGSLTRACTPVMNTSPASARYFSSRPTEGAYTSVSMDTSLKPDSSRIFYEYDMGNLKRLCKSAHQEYPNHSFVSLQKAYCIIH